MNTQIIYKIIEHKKFWIVSLLFFIFLLSSLNFLTRYSPSNLNGYEDIVEQNIQRNFLSYIEADINQNYPNLNEVYKSELLQKAYLELLENKKYTLSSGQVLDVLQTKEFSLNSLKENFKGENSQTYLNAIDPYYYFGVASYYYENGRIGELNENGENILEYRQAPIGTKTLSSADFHTFLIAQTFNLLDYENSTFSQKIVYMFWIPVILAILSGIFIFFILREYTNDLNAFFGSLLVCSIGVFVSRTVAGFSDTDGYNVLFPAAILLSLILSITQKNNILKFTFAGICGILFSLFIWAWSPGIFFLIIIFFGIFGTIFYEIIKDLFNSKNLKTTFKKITKDKSIENLFCIFIFFLGSFFVFAYLITSKNIFISIYTFLENSIGTFSKVNISSIWPNVESSIAELNKPDFVSILNSVGSKFIFILSYLGLLFLILDYDEIKSKIFGHKFSILKLGLIILTPIFLILMASKSITNAFVNSPLIFLILLFIPIAIGFIFTLYQKTTTKKIFFAITLSIWFLATLYMSLNGVRFILLLATPLGIGFGLFFYYLTNFITLSIKDKKNKLFNYRKIVGVFMSLLIFLFIFYPTYNNSYETSKRIIPNFDDNWVGLMNKIQTNSSEDSIITSWWDFGHFFSALSKRGTTFDGGSQSGDTSHFVGKLLLEDEKVSYEILKMLQCSHSRGAFDYALNLTNEKDGGISLIYNLLYKTFSQTSLDEKMKVIQNYENYNFSNEQIQNILNLLSCENPRENYLILSEDMIGKSGVWTHWGLFDFNKKYIYNNYKTLSSDEISKTLNLDKNLIEFYTSQISNIENSKTTQNKEDLINRWLSPYPSYLSDKTRCFFDENQNGIFCENGIFINSSMKVDLTKSQINSGYTFSNVYAMLSDEYVRYDQQVNQTLNTNMLEIVLLRDQTGIHSYIMNYPLGNSLFTKGFLLEGAPLNKSKFELFDRRVDSMGQKIITYKINWEQNHTR